MKRDQRRIGAELAHIYILRFELQGPTSLRLDRFEDGAELFSDRGATVEPRWKCSHRRKHLRVLIEERHDAFNIARFDRSQKFVQSVADFSVSLCHRSSPRDLEAVF